MRCSGERRICALTLAGSNGRERSFYAPHRLSYGGEFEGLLLYLGTARAAKSCLGLRRIKAKAKEKYSPPDMLNLDFFSGHKFGHSLSYIYDGFHC